MLGRSITAVYYIESIRFGALIAAASWLLHSLLIIGWYDLDLYSALFPAGPDLQRRITSTLAFGLVGAAISHFNSRALRKSERNLVECDIQYRTVLQSTFDGVIMVDDQARIVDVNKSVATAFAHPAFALLMLGIDDLIQPIDDLATGGGMTISEILAQDPTWSHGTIRVVATAFDGREFPAELKAIPNHYGTDAKHTIFIREITQRVEAETALRRSEVKYRHLFEQAPAGVVQSTRSGKILAANPAALRLFGYDSEKELCTSVTTIDLYANPEQRDVLLEALNSAGDVRNFRIEIRRRDGSTRTALITLALVDDTGADEKIFQSSFLDVTDFEMVAEALNDSEQSFRALTENALDIVSVIDSDGVLHYCSPSCETETGFSPTELMGTSVFDRIHADDRDAVARAITDSFAKPGMPSSLIYRYQTRDGRYIHMESSGRAFQASNGSTQAVINTRDITERLRAQEQLRAGQKIQVLGQLTGGIAHDFNNLLTVIVGNLQLLQDSLTDAQSREQAEMALRASLRGADLTRRLLAFARRQPLEPKVLNISTLVRSIEPLLCRTLSQAVRIRTELDEDIWRTRVDPAQMESAILNLVINARDAMTDEGELRIRTSNVEIGTDRAPDETNVQAGPYVCVEVIDNGSGMPEGVLTNAIEPFFSTKKEGTGTGLGLSMVYGFVRQSGGFMRMESEPGQGTTVRLFLPRSYREEEEQWQHQPPPLEIPRGKETVLVVDDNDDVRASAASILLRLGYSVHEASNGPDALALLAAEPVDVLFTDIKMPAMSGVELATRAVHGYPSLRVLLTSGYSDRNTRKQDADNPRFEFLPKPFNKHQLANRIRSVLDN